MEVGAVEQLSLAMLDPPCPGQRLTLWTVPIAARVEAVVFVAALIAAFKMTAEDCRAAHFDGSHHTPLFSGHRCAIVLSMGFAVATEHVRHFQPGAVHEPASAQKC
jgi:hypothetical protein